MYKKTLEKILKTEIQSFSEEQVFEIVKDFLLKKCEEYKDDFENEDLKKSWKKAFKNGITILGMLQGLDNISKLSNKPTERSQTPTYQRILKERAEKNKNREPSANLSAEDRIKQAREQARAEGQAIIDKYENKNKNKNINNFLKAISLNESSGGKNTNHKKMMQGIHTGDKALGQYGLMPNTIKEMAVRMGKDHPMSKYAKMDNNTITQSIKENPDHENQIANFLANHLYNKFGGDENKMAYSWFQGHNLTNNHFNTSHKNYMNHDYVQKYNKHKSQMGKTPQKTPSTDQKVTSND